MLPVRSPVLSRISTVRPSASATVAWYERNLPYEAASAIYEPSLLIPCFLQGRGERLALVGTVTAALALWLLIAAVLFLPLQGKRLGPMLLAGTLALIELGSALVLISLYTFNPIFRAYTSASLLLHRLLWTCCIGGIAISALVTIRRERRRSVVPVG